MYKINPGDTLSKIATANKTDVPTLLKMNPNITNPDLIQAGAELNLPDQPAAAASPTAQTSPIAGIGSATPGIGTSSPIRAAEATKTADQMKQDQDAQRELARLETQKKISDLKAAIDPGNAPVKPDLVGTFNGLRTSQGIDAIEGDLTKIRARKTELLQELSKYRTENAAGQAQGTANAQYNEKAQAAQDEYDRLQRDEQLHVDSLNSKNKYIETVMNLTDKDYTTARQEYNDAWTKNFNIQTQLASDENRERDDSRAFLTTTSNFIQNSGKSWDEIDSGMKAEIRKRELQAGFPAGTLEAFVRAKPKANLIATKDGTDASGNAVISFIYADENGNPGIVQTVPLKGVKGGSQGSTDAATFDNIKLEAASLFEADRQKNGDKKVSPQVYSEMRAKVPASYRDNFDSTFADLLSEETKKKFAIKSKGNVDDILNNYMNQ